MSEADKLDKLPKWAAGEIRRLRDSVDYWKARSDAAAGPEEAATTDTYIEASGAGGLPIMRGLPPGSRICFRLTPGGKFSVYISPEGALNINASDSLIAVEPIAANTINILPRARR